MKKLRKISDSDANGMEKREIEDRKIRFLLSLQYNLYSIHNREEIDLLEYPDAFTIIQGLIARIDDLELYVSTSKITRAKVEAAFKLIEYFRTAINELVAQINTTGQTNQAMNHFNYQADLRLSKADEIFSKHRHSQKCRNARKTAIIIIGIISIVGIIPLACIMLCRRRALFTTTTRTSQLCGKIRASITKLCKRDQKCSVSKPFKNHNKIARPEEQKGSKKIEAVSTHMSTSQYQRLHNYV